MLDSKRAKNTSVSVEHVVQVGICAQTSVNKFKKCVSMLLK